MNAESIATWARELSAIEDRVAEVQTEMRDQVASGRSEVKFLRERAKHLFGLISGREHEQLTLPEPAGAVPATETTIHVEMRSIDADGIKNFTDSPRFAAAVRKERAKARKRRPTHTPAKKKGGGRR